MAYGKKNKIDCYENNNDYSELKNVQLVFLVYSQSVLHLKLLE